MARFPAFATALAVHAAVFATLIVLPVFTPEPLPNPSGSPPLMPPWPLHPRVALADARPPAAPARTNPRRIFAGATPFTDEGTPAAPLFDLDGPPTDETADVPIDTNAFGANPSDGGSGECCRPPSGPEGVAIGPGGGSDGMPVRIGGDVRPPAKLHHVAPRYPELAIRARVSGTVEIECLIDETGRVTSVSVLSGHPLLAPAAVEAVRQWAYSPTRLNGTAVAILMSVSVRFELRR